MEIHTKFNMPYQVDLFNGRYVSNTFYDIYIYIYIYKWNFNLNVKYIHVRTLLTIITSKLKIINCWNQNILN